MQQADKIFNLNGSWGWIGNENGIEMVWNGNRGDGNGTGTGNGNGNGAGFLFSVCNLENEILLWLAESIINANTTATSRYTTTTVTFAGTVSNMAAATSTPSLYLSFIVVTTLLPRHCGCGCWPGLCGFGALELIAFHMALHSALWYFAWKLIAVIIYVIFKVPLGNSLAICHAMLSTKPPKLSEHRWANDGNRLKWVGESSGQ